MIGNKELSISVEKIDKEYSNHPSNFNIFKIFIDGSNTNQSKTFKSKENRRGGIGIYHPDSNTKIAEPFILENPTNIRAEWCAAIRALEWVREITEKHGLEKQKKIKVILYCDCQNIIDSMTKWLSGWKKKNWKKSDGNNVLNKELIVKMDNLISNRLPLTTFVKVKAHQKKPSDQKMIWLWQGNFIADKLADEGRKIAEKNNI